MSRYQKLKSQRDKSMEKAIDPTAVRLAQKLFGSGILNSATAQENLKELQKSGSYTRDNRYQSPGLYFVVICVFCAGV